MAFPEQECSSLESFRPRKGFFFFKDMHPKHLIRVWMALIFLAVASGIYLLIPNATTAPKTASSTPVVTQNVPEDSVATNTAIVAKTEDKPVSKPTETTTIVSTPAPDATPTPPQNTVEVTIVINGQKYALNMPEKSTAYEAMAQLVADKKITMAFKQFIGLGYFVDEVDGVKTDKNSGKYWIYYLNDKPAQMGISNYILKNNDSLTWKYEVPQF